MINIAPQITAGLNNPDKIIFIGIMSENTQGHAITVINEHGIKEKMEAYKSHFRAFSRALRFGRSAVCR
jgi:tRNA(Ser,Leu) C12 N-acetylase TAN1